MLLNGRESQDLYCSKRTFRSMYIKTKGVGWRCLQLLGGALRSATVS